VREFGIPASTREAAAREARANFRWCPEADLRRVLGCELGLPKWRQGPVQEGCEFRLMARPRLGEGLLELAARCRYSHPHGYGGSLHTTASRDRYRDLRFTMSKAESLPETVDARILDPIGVIDEQDTAGKARGSN